MTNLFRSERHIASSALCPLCGLQEELTMHILRGCVCQTTMGVLFKQ